MKLVDKIQRINKMKKILFLAGSFLAVSTLSLHVHAMKNENKENEVFLEKEEKKEDKVDFSYLIGDRESFVPQEFDLSFVKELADVKNTNSKWNGYTYDYHGNKDVEFKKNHKIFRIDEKSKLMLQTKLPKVFEVVSVLEERILLKETKILTLSVDKPYTVEVTYVLFDRFSLNANPFVITISENLESLSSEQKKMRDFLVSVRLLLGFADADNKKQTKNQLENIKETIKVDLSQAKEESKELKEFLKKYDLKTIFINLKKMFKDGSTLQEMADFIAKISEERAFHLMKKWLNGEIKSEYYLKLKPAFDIVIGSTTKGFSDLFLNGKFDESARKFFAAYTILFHDDESKVKQIKKMLENGKTIEDIANYVYEDLNKKAFSVNQSLHDGKIEGIEYLKFHKLAHIIYKAIEKDPYMLLDGDDRDISVYKFFAGNIVLKWDESMLNKVKSVIADTKVVTEENEGLLLKNIIDKVLQRN
jgi:RNase H-fold protein (predicted Holliday junction resolvase)